MYSIGHAFKKKEPLSDRFLKKTADSISNRCLCYQFTSIYLSSEKSSLSACCFLYTDTNYSQEESNSIPTIFKAGATI